MTHYIINKVVWLLNVVYMDDWFVMQWIRWIFLSKCNSLQTWGLWFLIFASYKALKLMCEWQEINLYIVLHFSFT